MTERIRNTQRRTISLALAGIVALLIFLQCFCMIAYADEVPSILDDFKDTEFNIEDYPEINDEEVTEDNFYNVFQIAETNNGELFVYVYHPNNGRKFLATTIRLSTSIGENAEFHDYDLDFIGNDKTIYKYKVKDFAVREEELRYYLIAAIHREWDAVLDKDSGGREGDEKAYKVGKLWRAVTVEGKVSYTVEEKDVVVVEVKSKPSLIRCNSGVSWSAFHQCDVHYVGYKFDRSMDDILSADIAFSEVPYTGKIVDKEVKLDEGALEKKKVHITSDQYASNDTDLYWFGKKFAWKRIMRTEEFLSAHEGELPDAAKENLDGTDWVFQFYETQFEAPQAGGLTMLLSVLFPPAAIGITLGANAKGVQVKNISLLQLTFRKAGKTYTLGVVDDKNSETWFPGSVAGANIPVWIYFVAIALVILVVLVVLAIVCPQVLPPLFNGVWLVVSAPFKLIGAAANSAKKASAARKERKAELEAEKDREEARKERRQRKRERERAKREREETDHE